MNKLQKYFTPEDVIILLEESKKIPVTLEEKEQRMLLGEHYSEMVIKEEVLPPYHLQIAAQLYDQTLSDNVQRLGNTIHQDAQGKEIVLISLVRAGIPLGIGINQAIKSLGCTSITHYAISIIRDVGIDHVAMESILHQHQDAEVYFVDGWTGKGTISVQLYESLSSSEYWLDREIKFVVYSDPAKTAWLSVSEEDLVLPFGLYNSIGFGLLSRTMVPENSLCFHTAVLHEHLESALVTRSVWIGSNTKDILVTKTFRPAINDVGYHLAQDWNAPLKDVKMSQLEVIRALLRRKPSHVFLDLSEENTATFKLITELCKARDVTLMYPATKVLAPYKAAALLGIVPRLTDDF